MFWIVAIFLFTLVLDQLTKYIIINQFSLHQSIPIIEDIFHFTYVQNPGAAFGILKGQTTFFIIVTIIAVVGIIYLYNELEETGFLLYLALGLALGGIFGNLIDRIRFGYVIDFLDFRIWPVFNIADSAIVVAVAIFSYYLLIIEPRKG